MCKRTIIIISVLVATSLLSGCTESYSYYQQQPSLREREVRAQEKAVETQQLLGAYNVWMSALTAR